ncbi:putative Adenosine deaminase [Vibrio nigripulchritudo MADA3029]|uniref:adenosine deaminase n=1 Tax=Vibrio nigripulchritudo TaxID=28173 RepID=UPI0003B1ECE2|nr:adenosine deaminase [Vibrio nigripulchritudo]CCN50865.1 putative Adenosine deaminase [Vibrio nigripulchritudo MADA3020]CCN56723.1 putative Adenosine deaminase [Vibrio nigripulchritudo MADA3021]CCN62580.1 putative Adenosine deaminase [Vibrio nigripulchritudo MADA3029]
MLDLISLPKAHLHLHLESAIRKDTYHEYCERDGVLIPQRSDFPDEGHFRGEGEWNYLTAVFSTIYSTLKTKDALERLVWELVEDEAKQGVVWIEPTIYVPSYRHIFGDDDASAAFFVSTFSNACTHFGIHSGFIFIADRAKSAEEAEEQALLASRWKDKGVVAFGLANLEVGFPGLRFQKAFDIAKAHGLLSAPHAGEMMGAENIWEALNCLNADRLAHGVNAVHDPTLMTILAERQICLDLCPTSNLWLKALDENVTYPLKRFLDLGIPCSVNTDNPLVWDIRLIDEYALCQREFGLSDADIKLIARNSIQFSGAPRFLKDRYCGREK